MEFKGTQGDWSCHLVNDDVACNCTFVLSDQEPICIATIHYKKDDSLEESEYPELERAKANTKLILAAPKLLEALKEMVEMYEAVKPTGGYQGIYESSIAVIKQATK